MIALQETIKLIDKIDNSPYYTKVSINVAWSNSYITIEEK